MLLAMSSSLPLIVAIVILVVGVIAFAAFQRSKSSTKGIESAGTESNAPTSLAPSISPVTEVSTPQITPSSEVAREQVVPADSPNATPEVATEIAEAPAARTSRLRDRFTLSQSALGQSLRALLGSSHITDDDWQDLEDNLIMADVGVKASAQVIAELKSAIKRSGDGASLDLVARKVLTDIVDGGFQRELQVNRRDEHPAIVLTVGVNGTGKTTTTGKLARLLSAQDKDVLLGAADTFRAAAAEQLATWGDRVGVPVVRGPEGSDPASVAFDAVAEGIAQEVDVVLIDTAGRLHTKQGLMDELGKVFRVASKNASIDEVLLVIDATTGQNGLAQAKVFAEVVPVTGVVLTKLDGTAKGGIIIAVQNELGVPVKLVGLGEGPDDLAPFDPATFVEGLF